MKPVRLSSSVSHLLQTEDEGLGTEDLVRLSGFTESLLDDVAIIVINYLFGFDCTYVCFFGI